MCTNDYPVEWIDEPEKNGLKRRVTKVYCPISDRIWDMQWERPIEEIE